MTAIQEKIQAALRPEITIEEIEKYKKSLRFLNDSKGTEAFHNGMAPHAAAILEEFFRTASDRVVIFCQNLSAEVYEQADVINGMIQCLIRGVKVDIICQDKPQSPALAALADHDKQEIPLTLTVAKTEETRQIGYNFAVMDGRAFRFEHDRNKPMATGCFNNPGICRRLISIFEDCAKREALA